MKKFILILAATLCVTSCGGNNQTTITKKKDVVYVCTGGYATKYHIDKNCKGLSNCKGRVVEMTKDEAVKRHKTPCKLCN